MSQILLVDDDADSRVLITRLLERAGHQVHCATSASDGIGFAMQGHPDLVIMDYRLVSMDGAEALSLLRRMDFQGRMVLISAVTDREALDEIGHTACDAFFRKPLGRDFAARIDALLAETAS